MSPAAYGILAVLVLALVGSHLPLCLHRRSRSRSRP